MNITRIPDSFERSYVQPLQRLCTMALHDPENLEHQILVMANNISAIVDGAKKQKDDAMVREEKLIIQLMEWADKLSNLDPDNANEYAEVLDNLDYLKNHHSFSYKFKEVYENYFSSWLNRNLKSEDLS